ncbi:MAG: phosphate ABC transporter ATP-binding protein PstB [Caldilineaceae bacterium]
MSADSDMSMANAAVEARDFNFYYRSFQALAGINVKVERRRVTALIGPSGCGKSTFLRALNRMHDLTQGTRSEGTILLDGEDVDSIGDTVALRKKVGMIFQQANPFPMSIFDNVAYGMRLESQRVARAEIPIRVEFALKRAALWDEVKDKLKQPGTSLSGGQQQRLCIARAIAVEPAVLLMDEPCAALDPIATAKVEMLIKELSASYTIIIVTHNMQQAARVSDFTAYFGLNEQRAGTVIEYGSTNSIFSKPKDRRTEDYITGRMG